MWSDEKEKKKAQMKKMGGMKWQIRGSDRKRKREGKEENRETGGPNSQPSFPPVLAPFFLLVTPG